MPYFIVVLLSLFAGVANAQMKVACVGDSITAPASGWCGMLGTKLGSGYTAKTFGVSGTTLLKNVGQPAFSGSSQYKPSHDYAPNIVVIMLGTNDSASRNWNAGKDHFVKDYEELIDSYTSLATKPRVFLNTPPPASDDNMFTISGTTIEKEINPLIKQVAMTKMVVLVDVWAAFGGDVAKISSFDGVHPGNAGQMLIADTVAKAIMSPVDTGSAGSAGSANAGSGGMATAGGSANAGGSATAGGGGMAMAGSSAIAGAGAGGMSASAAGVSGTSSGAGGSTSSRPNVAGSASLAGAGGSATAGSTSSMINGIGAAGMIAPTVATPESSDGGCRAAGNSATNSGPTVLLLLLLGFALRNKKHHGRHLATEQHQS